MLLERLISFGGLFVLVGIASLWSRDRRRFPWRVVVWGIALQLLIGLVVLSPSAQSTVFAVVDGGVRRLLSFSEAGADFVFQTIQPHYITGTPGEPPTLYAGHISPPVKTFAFWVLPSILFFSSLTAVAYHLGLLQRVVHVMAWGMQRTMGTSGAETLSTAANVFLGQTEAPLAIRPFIATLTRSELFCVMLGGFANSSGSILGAYASFLGGIPGIAGHLVTCSILSAPATLVVAKVMEPELERPVTTGAVALHHERPDRNIMQAAARGASEGMTLALNVAAMLLAFVALVALVNWTLSLVPVSVCAGGPRLGFLSDCAPLSLTAILGWVFTPMALVLGVPWAEAGVVGALLGEKMVLTEFVAYIHLGDIMAGPNPLTGRSALIASYALCGFANFASVGIQLGGIGAMAPERMGDLAELGIKAMIGGTLATFMTACVAGVLL